MVAPFGSCLVAVAAIVTPLGLYDAIVPSRIPQGVTFAYMQDPGPMGYGTPERSDLGFTRTCGDYLPMQCPGTTVEITYFENDTYAEANITNDDYDTRIPQVLAELYQSGLKQQPQSVSSFSIYSRAIIHSSIRKVPLMALDTLLPPFDTCQTWY